MANIYKSNYTGAKVDEAIRKVLNTAPEASDELQKKLKQIINLANYDFSTITNGVNKGITDLNADLAAIGSSVQGPIIQFLGELPISALSDTSLVIFPNYSTIIGLKTTHNNYTSGDRMTFTNATGSHVTFVRCYFDCFGSSDELSITRINNPVDYHFIDCTFKGSYTAALYIISNNITNNIVFDHCTFEPDSYPTSSIPGCIMLSSCYGVTFNNCNISNNRGGASGGYTNYCFYNMNSFGNWYINTCYNSVTGKPISESDVYLINNGIISPSLPEPVSYVSTLPTANDSSPSLVFLTE